MNKTLPHNIEVEQSVLSSILIDPKLIEEIALQPDHFYKSSHQIVFSACLNLYKNFQFCDLVTLKNHLEDTNQLSKAGGAGYLAELSGCPIAINLKHYADIIKSKSVRRNLIVCGNEIVKMANESTNEIESIIEDTQQIVISIEEGRPFNAVTSKTLIYESMDRYEALYKQGGVITGIPSGFPDLDNLTSGLQPADLIILAARPSMGKTALMLNMGKNIAQCGKAFGIFSLEMSKGQLMDRLISMTSGVNSLKFRSGNFSKENWQSISDAAEKIYDWNIYIDDTPALSCFELKKRARQMVKKHGVEIIFVDYLGLMVGDNKYGRVEEISGISRNLKACAKELNIPIIALSQLNRSLESRDNKRPRLSDLRDSGAIEQDADLVLFLYRDEVYKEYTNEPGVAELNIAKHRTGPTGCVKLKWNSKTTSFYSLGRGYDA